MSLNDQLDSLSGVVQENRVSTYKRGTNVKYMSGKDPILFRLLPALDPNNKDRRTSWLPFINPDGSFNNWGSCIRTAKFCGHGTSMKTRRELVSRTSLPSTQDNPIFCPLRAVHDYIKHNMEDWGYLVTDVGTFGSPNYQKACLPPIKPLLLANIYDLSHPEKGACIGEFTISSAKSMYDRTTGIMMQPNCMKGAESLIAQNYLNAYANGDITDPNDGPVLTLAKGGANAQYSGYSVTITVDNNSRMVLRKPMTQDILEGRKDLQNFDEYLNIPTEQEMVNYLIEMLNGRSPAGYHEYALLKAALPQFSIPDPPMAPGVMSSVQGFTAPAPAPAPTPAPVPTPAPAPSTSPAVPAYVPKASVATSVPAPQAAPVSPGPAPVAGIPGEGIAFDRDAFLSKLRGG